MIRKYERPDPKKYSHPAEKNPRLRPAVRKYGRLDTEPLMRSIEENPHDSTPRKVLADHLEEEGLHQDPETLMALRSDTRHPVAIDRHPDTGRVKAAIGILPHQMTNAGKFFAAAGLYHDTDEVDNDEHLKTSPEKRVLTPEVEEALHLIHPTSLYHIQHDWDRFSNQLPQHVHNYLDHYDLQPETAHNLWGNMREGPDFPHSVDDDPEEVWGEMGAPMEQAAGILDARGLKQHPFRTIKDGEGGGYESTPKKLLANFHGNLQLAKDGLYHYRSTDPEMQDTDL